MKDNILIAEFMDLLESSIPNKYWTEQSKEGFGQGELVELQYHTSWDWLMPVVQKIESLGYVFTIQGGKAEYGEMISKTQCFIAEDKLSSTYKAVVEFIKEHNRTTDYNKVTYYDGE
jgi:pyoverdine/dityrosine biosynthesis protein Dit1